MMRAAGTKYIDIPGGRLSSNDETAPERRLYLAVLALASEEGTIEERLARAYFEHLRDVDGAALPEQIRAEYEAIRAELAQLYGTPGRTAGIDRNTAIGLAMRIMLLFDATID